MYFEVYLDSLFIVQFIMNLLLLCLVKSMMKRRVSNRRMICGAFCAALFSVMFLLLQIPAFKGMSIGMVFSTVIMGVVTFRINRWSVFLRFVEKMSICTLLLGGMTLFILKFMPQGTDMCMGVSVVLIVGFISFLLLKRMFQRKEKHCCKVTLYGKEEVVIEALVDTGSSLLEPISGKPVAVLDKALYDTLFPDRRDGFRVIPYRSIGKKHGIMPAYLLDIIKIETEDGCMECREVYVGLSEEILTEYNSYKMILNPRILE